MIVIVIVIVIDRYVWNQQILLKINHLDNVNLFIIFFIFI